MFRCLETDVPKFWKAWIACLREGRIGEDLVETQTRTEPAETEFDLSLDKANPIYDLLDQWRLPLRETRAQVLARVGQSADVLFGGSRIHLPAAMSLPGAMAPWSASAFARIPPQFPIGQFTTYVWFENDAHINVQRTADHLASHLGPTTVERRWNAVESIWRYGRAELRLTAFPAEWQSPGLRNEAFERDPRLRHACRVEVATGAIQPLSDQERVWVAGLRHILVEGVLASDHGAVVGVSPPSETEMEYARDASLLPRGTEPAVGISADDEALVVIARQLFVMARCDIMHFEVARLTPAKGSGGSTLYAHCRTEAPAAESQVISLVESPNPDGLNDLAADLGRRLRRPVDIGVAFPDD